MASFDETTRANQRDSILVIVALLVLVGTVGAATAWYFFGEEGVLPVSMASIAFAGAYFAAAWFFGDDMVLFSVGAEHVNRWNYPVLNNVLQELCVATNLPMPEVYVIDDPGLNAFATGREPENASVAITSGLLERLNRDELQAVMAHEMTHVANYDIRFATLIAVTVGVVLLMRDFSLNAMRFGIGGSRSSGRGGRSGKGGRAGFLILAVCLFFIVLSPIFAVILQMMASRSREYMADTGAVKITRNPGAMISALLKLSGGASVLRGADSATSHLFFATPRNAHEGSKSSLFSSHPTIAERVDSIKRIYGIL